jgi:hypothetical protein
MVLLTIKLLDAAKFIVLTSLSLLILCKLPFQDNDTFNYSRNFFISNLPVWEENSPHQVFP